MKKTVAKFEASENRIDENGCPHIAIIRQLMPDGQPPLCPHCDRHQKLPLFFGLTDDRYFLRCQLCRGVMWQE